MAPVTESALTPRTVLALGSLAIAIFGVLCVRHAVPVIEEDIAGRVAEALAAIDVDWVSAKVSGRDVVLTGTAPDPAAVDAAVEAARVHGVRRLDSRLDAAEPVADDAPLAPAQADDEATADEDEAVLIGFATRFLRQPGRVTLDGAAPTEQLRRSLAQEAQRRFGVAGVEVRIDVARGAPEGWTAAAWTALDIIEELAGGEVVILDDALFVNGVAETTAASERIEEVVATALPPGFSGRADVTANDELRAILRNAPGLAQRMADRGGPQPVPAPEEPSVDVADLLAEQCRQSFFAALGERSVQFATGSDELTPQSGQLIDELAAVAKRCPGTRIAISGHTDDRGARADNLRLSQQRAEAVMAELVSRGVSIARLDARGYGEERPVADNDTEAGRARNRRIEFELARDGASGD